MKCSIDDCDNPVRTRGWCSAHYWRWHRHGDPLAGRTAPGSGLHWVEELLKTKPDNKCRDWPFGTTHGYASFGQNKLVGRYILTQTEGPSNGRYALHLCDRPICVAPWHLTWGDQKENMEQASERGRVRIGTSNPMAKLTEADVKKIRTMYQSGKYTQQTIAEMFGVTQSNVSAIMRRSWKSV